MIARLEGQVANSALSQKVKVFGGLFRLPDVPEVDVGLDIQQLEAELSLPVKK